MFKRRPEYFIMSVLFAVLLAAGVVYMVLTLPSASAGTRNNKTEDIVLRASSLVGMDEEAAEKAETRIRKGMMSMGDFLTACFTSPEYLLQGKDDTAFAQDLCYVLEGEADEDDVSDIVEDLEDSSRMAVIAKAASDKDASFSCSANVSSEQGSVISAFEMNETIASQGEYTIGIREANGSFSATGDEVRTDFFVDGILYRGYLSYGEYDEATGTRTFTLSWDTADVSSGLHDVKILLRSSDGRGIAVSGGTVKIPDRNVLQANSVANCVLTAGSDSAWYVIDCGSDNCFLNFVDIGDDINVTLYDCLGNEIGSNGHPGSVYEVLRGVKQDTELIAEQTGIDGISNCFYAEVRRGPECTTVEEDLYYKIVSSEDAAYYNGAYMAVMPGDDEDTLKLVDMTSTAFKVDKKDVKILPINGSLTSLRIGNSDTGYDLGVYPDFTTEMKEYAYYMNSGSKVTVYCDTLEGYAASVTITAFHGGAPTTLAPGQIYEVPSGETVLDVCVKSFNGKEYSYYVYLLNGNDDGTFYEQTLIQFPQSYYSGLWLMHNLHPDYIFTPYNTGLDFQTVLNAECKNGRSLAQYSSFPTYIKDNSPVYDGTDWMAVKPEVTSYFLDPRNFLVPDRIFMFEQLSFDSDLQTIAGVRSIIAGSFLDGGDKDYAQLIYDAGESAGVSPYFLASRIIQEMGYNGESELWRGEVDGYEGYYNFYNIGAYASADGLAVTNGAKYAMWGKEPDAQEISDTEAAILLPWDTPEKAIEGGALWIASGYIEAGQNTLYFQKFDIKQDGTELYTHQYAQNIMMAYSESRRYYNSYNDIGMLDQDFEFIIPVYENMPEDYGYLP